MCQMESGKEMGVEKRNEDTNYNMTILFAHSIFIFIDDFDIHIGE